jgi:hypothetical protein
LFHENGGYFPAGTQKQQADADAGEAGNESDLLVRVTLGVSEPQELAIARAHLCQCGTQNRLRIRLSGAIGDGEQLFGELFN